MSKSSRSSGSAYASVKVKWYFWEFWNILFPASLSPALTFLETSQPGTTVKVKKRVFWRSFRKAQCFAPKILEFFPCSIVVTNGNLISYINIQTLLQFLHHWHCKVKVLCSQPYLLLYLPIVAFSAIPLGTFWTTSPSPPPLTMTTAFLFFFLIMHTKSGFFPFLLPAQVPCTNMNRMCVSSKEKQ